MSKNRVMVLCLDAFHAPLGDQMIAEGRLPGLKRLKEQSAPFMPACFASSCGFRVAFEVGFERHGLHLPSGWSAIRPAQSLKAGLEDMPNVAQTWP